MIKILEKMSWLIMEDVSSLYAQARSSLGAATLNNICTLFGAHTRQKPVLSKTFCFFWLTYLLTHGV
jgi:hypothetical protein